MKAVSVTDYGGGFRLGADRAGLETLAKFEADNLFGRRSVAQVDANATGHESVLAEPGAWPVRRFDGIDVAYGNPPCAAFSGKGKGGGASNRSYTDQWYWFAEAAHEMRPRWTVMESVARVIGRSDGLELLNDIRNVIDDQAWLHHVVVNAGDVGSVQHHRRRYFAVITREDYAPSWPAVPPERTIKDVISPEMLPADHEDTFVTARRNRYYPIWQALGMNDLVEPGKLGPQYVKLFDEYMSRGGVREEFEEPWVIRHCESGEPFPGSGFQAQRLGWDRGSTTILRDSTLNVIHPDELRTISMREQAMLMGLGADYVFSPDVPMTTAGGIGAMIANGVTPEAGEFVLRGIGHTPGQAHAASAIDNERRATWWWSPWTKTPPRLSPAGRP